MTAKLDTIDLRGKSKAAANIKLSEVLKKGGLVVNQSVVLLMKFMQAKKMQQRKAEKIFIYLLHFLMNIRASNPPFLKLRQALMRWRQVLFGQHVHDNQ